MVKDIAKAKSCLIACFPALQFDPNFLPTSEQDLRFNCIAWAMRLNDRWVCESEDSSSWWPVKNSTEHGTRDALISAFQSVGFRKCPDGYFSRHYDIVALYYNPVSSEWTHAARLVAPGEFHSKMGQYWDIHHSGGNYLNNPLSNSNYGIIYQYMCRHKILRVWSLWLWLKRISIMFINELRCLF